MDDFTGDCDRLHATLNHLLLLNRLFSPSRYLARHLLIPHMLRQPGKHFSLCDIGAGGCDFARWIVPYARSRGIGLTVFCIDHDRRVVAYAKEKCRNSPEIQAIHENALRLETLGLRCDYVFSNHLLHHLSDTNIVNLLGAIGRTARLGYVMSDLNRARSAYWFYYFFSALWLSKSYARADGLLSIQKGFARQELEFFLRKSGISKQSTILRLFPAHWVVYAFNATNEGDAVVNQPKRVVVLGASPNSERYSYQAVEKLLQAGHEVIPVHPACDRILGIPCKPGLGEIQGSVDTVTVYVNADRLRDMEKELIALKPKRIIFNPGTENKSVADECRNAGIQVIFACTLVMLSSGQF